MERLGVTIKAIPFMPKILTRKQLKVRDEASKKETIFDLFSNSGLAMEDMEVGMSGDNLPIFERVDSLMGKKDPTHYRWPYLFGTNGVGKTFLAKKIARSCIIDDLEEVYFLKAPSFFNDLSKRKDSASLIDKVKFYKKLIIDDLFSHRITPLVIDALFLIFDYRFEYKMPTFVTSNLIPKQVASSIFASGSSYNVPKQLCRSISDRLFGLCVPIRMEGKSIRLRNTKESITPVT